MTALLVLAATAAVAFALVVARSMRQAAAVIATAPAARELPEWVTLPRQRVSSDAAVAWLLEAALVDTADA